MRGGAKVNGSRLAAALLAPEPAHDICKRLISKLSEQEFNGRYDRSAATSKTLYLQMALWPVGQPMVWAEAWRVHHAIIGVTYLRNKTRTCPVC